MHVLAEGERPSCLLPPGEDALATWPERDVAPRRRSTPAVTGITSPAGGQTALDLEDAPHRGGEGASGPRWRWEAAHGVANQTTPAGGSDVGRRGRKGKTQEQEMGEHVPWRGSASPDAVGTEQPPDAPSGEGGKGQAQAGVCPGTERARRCGPAGRGLLPVLGQAPTPCPPPGLCLPCGPGHIMTPIPLLQGSCLCLLHTSSQVTTSRRVLLRRGPPCLSGALGAAGRWGSRSAGSSPLQLHGMSRLPREPGLTDTCLPRAVPLPPRGPSLPPLPCSPLHGPHSPPLDPTVRRCPPQARPGRLA